MTTAVVKKEVVAPVALIKLEGIGVGMPTYLVTAGEAKCSDIPEDYAYVISSSGVGIKRKNALYSGIFKAEGVFGEVDNGITYDGTMKLPKALFMEVERLFLEVYRKFATEAVVLLHRADNGKWAFQIPEQKVSAAAANYTSGNSAYVVEDNLQTYLEALPALPAGQSWKQLGSIHSHASMSAFHSGTDDKDEFGFDGIHITIGRFNDKREYSCRLMFGHTAVKREVHEVVEGWEVKDPVVEYPNTVWDLIKKPVAPTYQYGVGGGYGFGLESDDMSYWESYQNRVRGHGVSKQTAVISTFNDGVVIHD